jgi:RNA polymerase sigma-70 factor (ECF subfamily)
VYRDNIDQVYRLMFTKVANRSDAEYLTTEIFVAAWGRPRVPGSAARIRHILAAAATTALTTPWWRTLRRPVTTLSAREAELALAGCSALSPAARMEAILAGLSGRDRHVLVARFMHARPIREVAAELGRSTARTALLQHRALRRAAQQTPECAP